MILHRVELTISDPVLAGRRTHIWHKTLPPHNAQTISPIHSMNSTRRGAIDSNGNYREKQEPELEEESNADSDEAEFYDGEEPYVEIDEDEGLSEEEEQGDFEGIVDKTIQVPDLDEVIKATTAPDVDPESQECVMNRGSLGGTKEVDAQIVEPFTPRLDKKGRPEYYYIPSKDALGVSCFVNERNSHGLMSCLCFRKL